MPSIRSTFFALVVLQIAHSIEEYVGRLWESFPPAMFLTGLVSSNHEAGFIILNTALILFGIWCAAVPVRRDWAAAGLLVAGGALAALDACGWLVQNHKAMNIMADVGVAVREQLTRAQAAGLSDEDMAALIKVLQ